MQGRRFNENRDFGRSPPVNVGDELDVKIEAVGEKGDGVAKKDGLVLFVPNVKEGDNVRIKVSRVLRKVGFAEVIGRTEGAAKEEEQEEATEAEPDFDEAKDSEDFGEESSEGGDDFTEDPEEQNDFSDDEEEKQ